MSRRSELLELDADLEENDIEDTIPALEDDVTVPGDENDASISITASDGGEVDIDDTASTVSGTLDKPVLPPAAADNELFLVTVFSHRAFPTPPPPARKPPKSDGRRAIGSADADDDDDDHRHDLDRPDC